MDFTLYQQENAFDTGCPMMNYIHEMQQQNLHDLQQHNEACEVRQQERKRADRAIQRERDATMRVRRREARKRSTGEARKCLFGSEEDLHVELKTQWDTSTECTVKPDEPVASYIRCVFGLPSNRGVSLCFKDSKKMSLSRIAENQMMFKDLGLDQHATITVLGKPNPFAPVEPLVGFDPFSSAQAATEGEQNPQDGACTVSTDPGLDQHAHAGTPDPFAPVAPWVSFDPFDAQVQPEVKEEPNRDPFAPVTPRNWVSFDPFTTQPDSNMAVNKSQGGSKNDATMDPFSPFSPFSPAMTRVDFVPFTSPTSVA